MTHIKIFNALLTIPFALAVGCSPDVSVEPPAEMATVKTDAGEITPKTLALKFDDCTINSNYFERTTPTVNTSISLLGTKARTLCNNQSVNQLEGSISCPISRDPDHVLETILASQTVYLRVVEEYWLPTVITSTSANNVAAVAMQGMMFLETGSSPKTSIGEIRASQFLPFGAAPKYATPKITTISLNGSSVDISSMKVNFKLPYNCLITGSSITLLSGDPYWDVKEILISSSPDFN